MVLCLADKQAGVFPDGEERGCFHPLPWPHRNDFLSHYSWRFRRPQDMKITSRKPEDAAGSGNFFMNRSGYGLGRVMRKKIKSGMYVFLPKKK